jgi:hypothetical protein
MLPTTLMSAKAAGSHTAHRLPVIDFLEAQSSEFATDDAFSYNRDGLGVSQCVAIVTMLQGQGPFLASREEVVRRVPNWSEHDKLNAEQMAAPVKQVTKTGFQLSKVFQHLITKQMIPPTPALDAFIATPRNKGLLFASIQATFSSPSKDSIKRVEAILQKDGLPVVVKRYFLWKWQLMMTLPIVGPYNEEEYQKIVGKLVALASKSYVYLHTVLLVG